jgi:hypothetical protein
MCRASFIAKRVDGKCERCPELGYIVHHKVRLTEANHTDARIALNHSNLEYVCLACHNAEHMGLLEATVQGVGFDADGNVIKVGRERSNYE